MRRPTAAVLVLLCAQGQQDASPKARRAQLQRYGTSVAAAAASLELGRSLKARAHLNDCPKQVPRGFEYFHLLGRVDPTLLTLDGHERSGSIFAPGVVDLRFAPDDVRLLSRSRGSADALSTVVTHDIAKRGEASIERRSWVGPLFRLDGTGPIFLERDTTLRLVVVEEGQARKLVALEGEPVAVGQAVVSWKAHRLLASGTDGVVRLWDTRDGRLVARNEILKRASVRQGYPRVALAEDGSFAAVASDYDVRVLDAHTGRVVNAVQHNCRAIAISDDGTRLAIGDEWGTVDVFELSSCRRVHRLEGHATAVRCLDFEPGTGALLSGSDDGTVRIWQSDAFRKVEVYRCHGDPKGSAFVGVTSVACSHDKLLLAAGCDDGRVRLWWRGLASGYQRLRAPVARASFRADGRVVYAVGEKRVDLLDAAFLEPKETFESENATVRCVAGRLAVSTDDSGRVFLSQVSTGLPVRELRKRGRPLQLVVASGDGRRVAALSDELLVWDVDSGEEVARVRPETTVRALALSHDGKYIAMGADSDKGFQSISVRELTSGNTVARWLGHRELTCMLFSPDGGYLATGGRVPVVVLWNARTGALLHQLRGHREAISALAFSPDGSRLATGAWDGKVIVWHSETGRELVRLPIGRGGSPVESLAFSPDGFRLAASDLSEIRLWEPAGVLRTYRDYLGHARAHHRACRLVDDLGGLYRFPELVARTLRQRDGVDDALRLRALRYFQLSVRYQPRVVDIALEGGLPEQVYAFALSGLGASADLSAQERGIVDAMLQWRLGRCQDALAGLQKASADEHPLAEIVRAMCLIDSGEHDDARESIKRAKRLLRERLTTPALLGRIPVDRASALLAEAQRKLR